MDATYKKPKEVPIKNNSETLKTASNSKSLCRILTPTKKSFGFLIQFKNEQIASFYLITDNQTISKNMIEDRSFITICYDNETKSREIKLNPEERLISNFTINLSIVEILKKDNIEKDYFIFNDINYINNLNELKNKEILILEFQRQINGKLKTINGNEFTYITNNESVLLGSPIFLKDNMKIIGINKGTKYDKTENYGNFIWFIYDFLKNYDKNKRDGIKLDNNEKIIELDKNNTPKVKKLNKMTIIYKIEKDKEKMPLFGPPFVYTNRNNCYLLIDNQKYEIVSEIKLNQQQ